MRRRPEQPAEPAGSADDDDDADAAAVGELLGGKDASALGGCVKPAAGARHERDPGHMLAERGEFDAPECGSSRDDPRCRPEELCRGQPDAEHAGNGYEADGEPTATGARPGHPAAPRDRRDRGGGFTG